MADAYQEVVGWARAGELIFSIERAPLSQIEAAWTLTDLAGKRFVILPPDPLFCPVRRSPHLGRVDPAHRALTVAM